MIGILSLALALAVASPPPPPRAPIVTKGCQGEGCYETGSWIAKRTLPLFDRVNGRRRTGTIRKGTRVLAIESRVVTTQVGVGRMLRSGDYLHNYGADGPRTHVRKGELVYLLYDEGEGLHAAMTRGRRRISVNDYAGDGEPINFLKLRSYAATDWVKVRLPDGRIGWSRPRNSFRCASHMDDIPGQCRSISRKR